MCIPAWSQLDTDRELRNSARLQLTPAELEMVNRDFTTYVKAELGEDMGRCLKENAISFEASLRASRQRVGPERNEALLVQNGGICISGATNEALFLYGRLDGTWRRILNGTGIRLRELHTTANGWPDMELSVHNSASSTTRYVYRFNSTRYVAVDCINQTSWPGHPRTAKEPCAENWRR